MPIEYQRVEDLPPGESTTICLFGPSGVGKTWLCGTLGGPDTVYINIGDGRETLSSPLFRQKHPESKGMLVVDIEEKIGPHGIPETAQAFDMLTDVMDDIFTKKEIKNIIIDDLNALSRAAIVKALEINQATGKSKSKEAAIAHSAMISTIQDFGMEMTMVSWFTSSYCALAKQNKVNLVITGLPLREFQKGEKIGDLPKLVSVLPRITGKYAPDFPGFFDDVWYMEQIRGMAGVVTQIRTRGDNVIYAKTRHAGVFKDTEMNPNLRELLNRIKKGE